MKIEIVSEAFATLDNEGVIEVINAFMNSKREIILMVAWSEGEPRIINDYVDYLSEKDIETIIQNGTSHRERRLFDAIFEKCNSTFNREQFEYLYGSGLIVINREEDENENEDEDELKPNSEYPKIYLKSNFI